MALNSKVKHLLSARVSDAQSINDIMPLLKSIPFEEIQEAILQVIAVLDTNTANDIKYKSLSMTDILPDDIMQHIVSFTDSLNMKYINKPFYTCYNKNKLLELKQRQCIIEKHVLPCNVQYQQHNDTWIIHPTRNHLDSEEIAKGYKGPLNDLRDVVDAVKSGDKLLFHDGKYAETNSAEFCFLDTAGEYQVIGIGNNVFIEFCNMNESFLVSRHLSFKNVTLEMGDGFQIDFNGSLSMEDCEIVLGSSHIEIIHGSFHAKNCVFSGGNVSPIQVYCKATVATLNVIGCTFTHYSKTCISLFDDANNLDFDADVNYTGDTSLKCVGNVFKDNFGYPIAMHKIKEVKQKLKSVITHNILEGYNGVYEGYHVDTANKLYCH
eukprot:253510_1